MSLKEKLGDWVHTEQFTVHEAACLWAGYLPGNVVGLDAVVQSKIQAAKRLIAMDLRHTLDTSENAFSMIGNHDQSYVHRADLVALAEQKGIKPAFLYIDG